MCTRTMLSLFILCAVVFAYGASNHDVFNVRNIRASPHVIIQSGPLVTPPHKNRTRYHGGPNHRHRSTILGAELSPVLFKSVYNMNQSMLAGDGKTIAIIDAFAHPNAEADLAVFSTFYGLPPCTTENGCFKRVNQIGTTDYISATSLTWSVEVCLDLQWAHAIAPGAKLLYVEANSDSLADLFTAAAYASKHADYVSMSFGAPEFSSSPFENVFTIAGVSFFASTGDTAQAVNYPAVSPNVVAVGGTTLYTTSELEYASEEGWSQGGGGCSIYYKTTTAQSKRTKSLCGTNRAVPDVSYNGDPNSGVYVYCSEGCTTAPSCYYKVGGTSLSAPVMAANAAASKVVVTPSLLYGGTLVYRDITTGGNGHDCVVGYDLSTGMGCWIAGTNNSDITITSISTPTSTPRPPSTIPTTGTPVTTRPPAATTTTTTGGSSTTTRSPATTTSASSSTTRSPAATTTSTSSTTRAPTTGTTSTTRAASSTTGATTRPPTTTVTTSTTRSPTTSTSTTRSPTTTSTTRPPTTTSITISSSTTGGSSSNTATNTATTTAALATSTAAGVTTSASIATSTASVATSTASVATSTASIATTTASVATSTASIATTTAASSTTYRATYSLTTTTPTNKPTTAPTTRAPTPSKSATVKPTTKSTNKPTTMPTTQSTTPATTKPTTRPTATRERTSHSGHDHDGWR